MLNRFADLARAKPKTIFILSRMFVLNITGNAWAHQFRDGIQESTGNKDLKGGHNHFSDAAIDISSRSIQKLKAEVRCNASYRLFTLL